VRGCVTPEIAAEMAVGMAVVSGHARGSTADAERAELARYATYQLTGAILGRARRTVGRAVARLAPSGQSSRRDAGQPVMPGAAVATAEAIAVRFEREGLVSPAGRDLLAHGLSLARAAAASGAPPADAEAAPDDGCVEPRIAAWFALSMLEAAGVVRSVNGRRPGALEPVRWWWAEPPALARIPTGHILRALPRRYLAAARRRLAR
jgi:hypothetical protein